MSAARRARSSSTCADDSPVSPPAALENQWSARRGLLLSVMVALTLPASAAALPESFTPSCPTESPDGGSYGGVRICSGTVASGNLALRYPPGGTVSPLGPADPNGPATDAI